MLKELMMRKTVKNIDVDPHLLRQCWPSALHMFLLLFSICCLHCNLTFLCIHVLNISTYSDCLHCNLTFIPFVVIVLVIS